MMWCSCSRMLDPVRAERRGVSRVGGLAQQVDADHAVVEEPVDPRPPEDRDLAGRIELEEPSADLLGDRQDPVDRVGEQGRERVRVHTPELEPERGGLQHVALDALVTRRANQVGVAGAIDEDSALVGDAAGLVLHDDVGDAAVLDDAAREPRVVQECDAAPFVAIPPTKPYRSMSRVRAPFRAAAVAATTPAAPPPQTMTSQLPVTSTSLPASVTDIGPSLVRFGVTPCRVGRGGVGDGARAPSPT
jgi:hypothetical protein